MGKLVELLHRRRERHELKAIQWQNKRLVRYGQRASRVGGERQSLHEWHDFLAQAGDAVLHNTSCHEGEYNAYEIATLREGDMIVSYIWRAGWKVRYRPQAANKADTMKHHNDTQTAVNIEDTLL